MFLCRKTLTVVRIFIFVQRLPLLWTELLYCVAKTSYILQGVPAFLKGVHRLHWHWCSALVYPRYTTSYTEWKACVVGCILQVNVMIRNLTHNRRNNRIVFSINAITFAMCLFHFNYMMKKAKEYRWTLDHFFFKLHPFPIFFYWTSLSARGIQ